MQKIIICDTDKCTGCRICEYICSSVHEGKINPRLARIRTIKKDPVFDFAISCRKCENADCINVCARDAIMQDTKTKMIKIDKDKCDGCGMCVNVCNFGVLTLGIDKKLTTVCNFCRDQKRSCALNIAQKKRYLILVLKISMKREQKFFTKPCKKQLIKIRN